MNLQTTRTNTIGELFFCAMYRIKSFYVAGTVDATTANKINKEIGLNFKGWSIILNTDNLVHLLSRHFRDGKPKHRDVTYRDLGRIGSVVLRHDSVEPGNKPDRLLFKRKFPDGILCFVVEIDKKGKNLSGKTLWIRTGD